MHATDLVGINGITRTWIPSRPPTTSSTPWQVSSERYVNYGVIHIFYPASYSGGPGFKSQLRDRLSLLRCSAVFFRPFRQMLGLDLKLGHDHLLHVLSNSSFAYFPFIWPCIIWVADKASLNKLPRNTFDARQNSTAQDGHNMQRLWNLFYGMFFTFCCCNLTFSLKVLPIIEGRFTCLDRTHSFFELITSELQKWRYFWH
jgi:hypothetical protein